MELKKLYLSVDLVGYWYNSFEDNLLFTLGKNEIEPDSKDFNTAEAYVFHIMDENKNLTKNAVVVSFRQDDDNIILGYGRYRFAITAIYRDEIIFTDGLSTYSFNRVVS